MRFEYELSNIIKGYKTSYDRNQFVRSLVQFVKERNDPELQLTDAKKKKLLEQEYRENFGFFMGLPSDFMSLVIKALLDIKDCNFLPRLLLGQCTTQAKIQTFCSLIDLILIMSPDEEEHVYSAARYALVKAMHSPVMTRHNKTVAQKVLSQDSAFILEFIGTKLFKDDMYKRSFWMHDENEQQCFIDRLKDYPEILHRLIATCEYVETQMLLLSQKRAENNSEYNRKTLLYALASLPPNGVDRLANVFSRTDANGENFYVYIDEPKDDGPDQKEGEGLLKMLTSKEGVNGDTVMHQLARHHSGSVLDSVREIAARKPERLTELLCVEDRQKNTPLTVLLKKTPNVFTEIMQLIMTNDYYQPSYNKVMRKFLSQVEESKKLFGQWLLEIKPQDVVLVFNELFSTDSYDWIDQLKEYSTLVRKKVLTSFLQMMDARTAMTNFSREFITFCNDEEMFTDADSQSGAMYDNYVTMISQVDPETIKNMILPEKVLEDVVCLIVEQGKLQRQSEDYYYSGREAKRRDEERLKHYWRLVAKAVIQGRNHSRFESLLESVLSDDQSVCDFFGYDASIVLLKDDTIRPELKQKLFKNLIYNDHERVLMDAYTVSVQYITPAILRRNLIPPEENTAAFLHKLIIDDKSLFLRLLEGMLERYQKKCMAMKTNSSNNSEGMLPLFTVFMDQYPIESCAWICEHKEVFKALVNSDDKRLTNSINKSLSRLFIQQGEDVRELYDLLTKDRIITVHNEMVLSEYDNDTLISLSETLFDYVLKRRGNPFRIVESVYSRDCLAKDSIKKLVKSMASNSVLRNNISSFDATRMFFLLTDTDENELKRKHKKIPAEQQVKMGIELLSVFNKDGYLHILENSDGFNIRFFSYLHHLHTLKPNSSLLLEFMSQQLVGLDGWGSLRDMFFYNNTRSDIWNHVSPQTREFICKDFLTNATMRTLCSVAKYDFKFLLPAFPRATPAKCVIDWIIGRFESEQGDESCEAMSEWLTYTNMDWLNAEQVAKLFKSRLGFYLLRNNSDLFMKLRKKLKEDSFMFNYKHKEYGTYLDNIFRIYTGYQDTLIEACLEHVLNGLSKGSELGEKDVLQLDVIYKAWRKYQSGKKSVYSFISGFSLLRKFLNKSAQSLTPINEFYTIEKRSIKATKEEATDTLAEAVDYLDALERIYNGYDSSATEPEDLKVIESEVIKVCNALTGWLRSNPGELSEDQVDNIITMAKKVITRCWCPDGSKVSAMLQKEFRNLVDAYEHYLSLDPKWIDKLPVEAISDVKMMGHSSNYNDDDDDDDDYVRDVTNITQVLSKFFWSAVR